MDNRWSPGVFQPRTGAWPSRRKMALAPKALEGCPTAGLHSRGLKVWRRSAQFDAESNRVSAGIDISLQPKLSAARCVCVSRYYSKRRHSIARSGPLSLESFLAVNVTASILFPSDLGQRRNNSWHCSFHEYRARPRQPHHSRRRFRRIVSLFAGRGPERRYEHHYREWRASH